MPEHPYYKFQDIPVDRKPIAFMGYRRQSLLEWLVLPKQGSLVFSRQLLSMARTRWLNAE